ncbi:MAG TPA: hypothetical protein VFS21_33260 [Roseiflexaceae bacterium]|nr:hypothetical protein [Roseiflexaceae bacterium]
MYVIHLDVADFEKQTQHGGPRYAQHLIRPVSVGGVRAELSSAVILAGTDPDGVLHTARLLVERVSLMGPQDHEVAVRRVVFERAVEALQIAERALGVQRHGLLLEPGLRDDLMVFESEHNLWSWEGDIRDVLARRLVQGARNG